MFDGDRKSQKKQTIYDFQSFILVEYCGSAVLLLALAVNQKMSRSCCIISSLIALMPQQQSSLLVVVALSLDSQMSHVVDRIWVSAH